MRHKAKFTKIWQVADARALFINSLLAYQLKISAFKTLSQITTTISFPKVKTKIIHSTHLQTWMYGTSWIPRMTVLIKFLISLIFPACHHLWTKILLGFHLMTINVIHLTTILSTWFCPRECFSILLNGQTNARNYITKVNIFLIQCILQSGKASPKLRSEGFVVISFLIGVVEKNKTVIAGAPTHPLTPFFFKV